MSRTSMTTAVVVFISLIACAQSFRKKTRKEAEATEDALLERTSQDSLAQAKEVLLDNSVATKGPPRSKNGWCLPHQKCTWSDCCSLGTSCNTCPGGYHGERAFGRCAFKGHYVCNSRDCRGQWSAFSPCSKTCGGGHRSRKYTHIHGASRGGRGCSIRNGHTETQRCNLHPCPVDCSGHWDDWSTCSATCKHSAGTDAFKSRKFLITRSAQHGGRHCSHSHGAVDREPCSVPMCPRDCEGTWGEWTRCSASCGAGQQTRSFTVTKGAEHGGKCDFKTGQTESRQCRSGECPIACIGSWSDWSVCERTCGECTQTRSFAVTTKAKHGGKQCEVPDGKRESKNGNLPACCPPGNHFLNTKGQVTCYHETTYEELDVSCCNQ